MTNFFEKHFDLLCVLGFAFIIGLASAYYFFAFDLINANGDSIARLNISRRTIDSVSPGFAHIGYAWPPIQLILMAPLTMFDGLYRSGLAGLIPSFFSFVLAAIFMYKIGEHLWGRFAGFAAFALFVSNPNILYAQSTPLSEIFYTASILGMVYFVLRWTNGHSEKFLFLSALFLIGATLSRYDGWFIAILAIISLIIYSLYTFRDWHRMEGVVILFAMVALLGPVLWMTWNYAIFENPIYFAVGEYSAKIQQADLLKNGLLPSYHDLSSTIMHIYYSAKHVGGEMLLLLGTVGFILASWSAFREKKIEYIFLSAFFGQILYYIVNLYFGNGVIFVPELFPYHFHNIRYAVTFMPFFIFGAIFLGSKFKILVPVLMALIILEYGALASTGSIVTLNESLHGFAGRDAHKSRIVAGEWIANHYDKGYLLADTFNNDSVIFYSNIHLKSWITDGTPELFWKSLKNPSDNVDWVLMREGDKIWNELQGSSELKNYKLVYDSGDILIYKRI